MTNLFGALAAKPFAAASGSLIIPAVYDVLWSAVCFVIVLTLFRFKVLPKVQTMLDERAAAIEGNIAKADEAQAKAEAKLQEYTKLLAAARSEAGEIRDAARADANKIVAQAKEEATAEQARIVQAAKDQIGAERQAAVVALRSEVGTLAIDLASRVVGESLTDDAKSNALVDRFLTDLEKSETVAN